MRFLGLCLDLAVVVKGKEEEVRPLIYTNEGARVFEFERKDRISVSDKSLKSGGAMTIDRIQLCRRVAMKAMGR